MMNKKSTVLLLALLFMFLNLNLFAQEVSSKIHPVLQVVLLETPAPGLPSIVWPSPSKSSPKLFHIL